MRLDGEIWDEYREKRISIREVTVFSPMDYRPNRDKPFVFKVNYYVQGKAPAMGAKPFRMQECTDIINLDFMGLTEEEKEALEDYIFAVKAIFEKYAAKSFGLESESEALALNGAKQGNDTAVQSDN